MKWDIGLIFGSSNKGNNEQETRFPLRQPERGKARGSRGEPRRLSPWSHMREKEELRFRVSLKRLGLGLSRKPCGPLVSHRSWSSVRTRLGRPVWKTPGQGWDQFRAFLLPLSVFILLFQGNWVSFSIWSWERGKNYQGEKLENNMSTCRNKCLLIVPWAIC